MTGLGSRRAALVAVSLSLVGAVATTSSAATLEPVLVKDDPQKAVRSPTAAGAWFGWTESTADAAWHYEYDFFVQRGTDARIKVNEPERWAHSGAILNHAGLVIYAQWRTWDGEPKRPRLMSFNLTTKKRAPLPAAVNQATWHTKPITINPFATVTASGPWVLYEGETATTPGDYPFHHVVLYNRITQRLRVLATVDYQHGSVRVGQVNGRFATWVVADNRPFNITVVRRNLRTGKDFEISTGVNELGQRVLSTNSAVSPDGTLYYWRGTEATYPTPWEWELMRKPFGGGAPEVLATLDGGSISPYDGFVRYRRDGSKDVFYGWNADIYKVIDPPSSP